MMEDSESEILAIQLARRVLQQEITIDFALVRAQTSGVLTQFVANLNTLSGHDYFDLEVMKARVSQGIAGRAVAGRTDPFPLPKELEGWNPDWIDNEENLEELPPLPEIADTSNVESQGVPDAGEKTSAEDFQKKFREGIQNLDRKVKELRLQREEVNRLLHFLENIQEKRTEPPRPWIGSVVILIVSCFIAGVAFLVLRSPVVPALLIVGSAFLAAFLFQREYAWYERLIRIEKADAEHRARNIQLHKKQIEECKREIREIRKDARLRLTNLEGVGKEMAKSIKAEFPVLFSD
ncbi:MAG: hypothetical protein KC931_10945 [Candidatus Omnitrophica bacterium]|nr:hypothetical protein [Candidatus Omnitrophota bacterium]